MCPKRLALVKGVLMAVHRSYAMLVIVQISHKPDIVPKPPKEMQPFGERMIFIKNQVCNRVVHTKLSQDWTPCYPIDDQNPAFGMHDEVSDCQVNNQLVSSRS